MTADIGEFGVRWSAINKLANLTQDAKFKGSRIIDREPDLEACLRRVLRPHNEAGFKSPADDWMIAIRKGLDQDLLALTLREIREQLGLTNAALPNETATDLRILAGSQAFLRYVNAYLFFAIRFLVSRTEQPASANGVTALPCADLNVRPFALTPPPLLTGVKDVLGRFDAFERETSREPDSCVDIALCFLDDYHPQYQVAIQYELQEPSQFELWLRELYPEIESPQTERFMQIKTGLIEWAVARSKFYLSLNPPSVKVATSIEEQAANERPPQGWIVTHPLAARLALADVYWIARLLRADVSENATVTYQKYNWLHLLRFNLILGRDLEGAKQLEKAEEALRSVFDYVCDLIQNSVEITREEICLRDENRKPGALPETTERWRAVFNEELEEIARQRRVRHFLDPSLPPEVTAGPRDAIGPIVTPGPSNVNDSSSVKEGGVVATGADASSDLPPGECKTQGKYPSSPIAGAKKVWSNKVTTGEVPFNLIGVAFSGGGIRSATFNLGVLEGLQELDLLRNIDYISTVSGGGFIGSWLVANVRRSAQWLGRLTDWSDSIAHLRSHSNYLAPRKGLLSVDTWNIGNSWFRNAALIQLSGLTWLFALLLATWVSFRVFLFIGGFPIFGYPFAASVLECAAMVVAITIPYYLGGANSSSRGPRSGRSRWVRWLAVVPALIGACALASQFWAAVQPTSSEWSSLGSLGSYSALFLVAWKSWAGILIPAFAGFVIFSLATLRTSWGHCLWISPLCTLLLYLELAGIYLLLQELATFHDLADGLGFVFGPPLVLLAFSICVLLLIGFTGSDTDEARREWWTRFGTWMALFGGMGVVLSGIVVFGPCLVLRFFQWTGSSYPVIVKSIKWTSILGSLGTVIGGLFAGKSSKTSGEGQNSPGLETLANVGGFLFILLSFLAGSTLLYLLMFGIFAPATLDLNAPVQVIVRLNFWLIAGAFAAALIIGLLFSWRFEINIFGLNQFYRNRLVLCYLGATRWSAGARKPNPFTKFDFRDDLKLARFRTKDSPGPDMATNDTSATECGPYSGPLPILNCSLNLGGSSDLALNTRHSASFTLTPLRCGSDRPKVGYAPTFCAAGSFADGVPLGQAVSISGAAVSSNMGYSTSPLVAFLLTMFNVRLGWWFPNPGQPAWNRRGMTTSIYYLLRELLGIADENRYYLNVSDGGHFENLGIYELVRRRCKLIIASDAECDEDLQFGGLGNLMRICETDFGAHIDLDVKSIHLGKEGYSLAHCTVGTIKYSSGEIGRLIYLKASVTGDEDVSIAQYRSAHPSFPHESTANQFYSEDQFESYRRLGLHIVRSSFKGNLPGDDPLMIAERMVDVLTPAGCTSDSFLKHSSSLREIWEKFRSSVPLLSFMRELTTLDPKASADTVSDEEMCIGLEMIQLMEDVFLDLRLDDFWEHPDNRGWAILFMRWARSPRFRIIWEKTRRTFGIRFEYFCHSRLGLRRDRAIVRV
jgi:hypothetical protein